MAHSLLKTKTRIPLPPRRAVPRARLIEALEHSVPHYRLILVSAPAGYGKTTLLAQWAHSSRFSVAWLSLSDEDNEVERFFRYLLAAWEAAQPDVIDSPLGILLGGLSPDTDAILAAFINVAADVPDHTVFVLDDYHLIEVPAIHEALTFLLDHLPRTLHFVLAGRGEPPLPLARYRARDEMVEYKTRDLRFRRDETADFLNERIGRELAPGDVETLQAQLEGWIAGIQLVALSLRRRLTDTREFTVSGRQRFIADYLREEVLVRLPDDMRQFLLQTSILEQLCDPLCDAVTGKADGQEMLEMLERENLFLVPLDDSRHWFRYHRLFADFLQEELQRRHPDDVTHLHRRAAGWYLARDLPDPAFRHAVEGQDVERVIQIFERYVQMKLTGGEFRLLERWLDALPEAWQADYPIIGLMQTCLLLFTGRLDASVRCVEDVEQGSILAAGDDSRWQVARLRAVRCCIACFQNDLAHAERFAKQAATDLPDEDHLFRAILYGSLGDTYRRHGRWEEAKTCYLELLDFIHAPEFRVQSAHVFGALADLELRQGKLRDAAGYWRNALAAIHEPENWGRLPLPLTGWVYIRMAELLYERNELAAAWDYLADGLERAELGGDVRAMIAGYLIAGRLKLTEGDTEAAEAYLEQARPHVESAQFSHWSGRFERFQLVLWLEQDRLRTAANWADEMLQDEALEERPESEVAQLALARVLIVKADRPSVEEALVRLASLLQLAQEEGRTGVQAEVLALQALAHWRRGDDASALTTLEQALRLAEPEGYLRLFADLGLPMGRLLQEARSRQVMPDYVDTLLAAFGGDAPLAAPAQPYLPEPLTEREEEVLAHIAAGLTNAEIAEQLIISIGTVKKHAGNIYGKLGVGSRTEAAATARELDLLD